jgi:DNA-binding CsgD family transcriptional regulator
LKLAVAGNTSSEQQDALTLCGAILCLEEDYRQGLRLLDEGAALMKNRLGHLQYLLAWGSSLANCGAEALAAIQQDVDRLYQWGIMTQTMLASLLALPAQAVVMAHRGFSERGVELLGLAFRFPSSLTGWMSNWPLLTRLRTDLEAELGPEKYAAAWERGKGLNLDTVIADLATKFDSPLSQVAAEASMDALSERELEVLRLVSAGLSNPEIAQTLVVATGTVKTHVHNICAKLGVRNRLEAVMRAQALKLV